MKCEKCNAICPATAKFCPSCGALTDDANATVSRSEVDVEWMGRAMSRLGYTYEVNGSTVLCKHETRPTVVLGRLADPPLVTMQIHWRMPAVPMLKRWEFADTMNKANGANWICTFTYGPSNLSASSFLYLPETSRPHEVVSYFDTFITAAAGVLESSGMLKFA